MSRTLRLACVAALAAAFAVTDTHAADALPTPSIASLLQRVPDLPATAEEAARWVDRGGRLVHPGLLALQADLAAHERAMEPIQRETARQGQAQGAVVADNLNKGLASAGVDMERLQRDPAYAQQVQARLQGMSPQELMALSQKMNAPLNADPRFQNEAQAVVDEAPAVRAAAEAGRAYAEGQVARVQAQQQLWREADAATAALRQRPLQAPVPKPRMPWDSAGCDAACHAEWARHANAMLPLLVARDTEVLRLHHGALQRHRASVADGLKAADRHLVAARYGASARSQGHRGLIAAYDGAALGEIRALVERITDSVKTAAVVVHCGQQVVLAPGAVCQ